MLLVQAHGSYQAIDGGYSKYATVELCCGHSQAVGHARWASSPGELPEQGMLIAPETSLLTTVAQMEVRWP